LELTDPGFDHTVLTGFRQRLIDHGLEEKVLDLLLARLGELEWSRPEVASALIPPMCSRRCAQSTGWSSSQIRCEQRWRRCPQPPRTGWPPHRCRMGATVWRPSRFLSASPRRGQAHHDGRAGGC
jgi:hypothetical protein